MSTFDLYCAVLGRAFIGVTVLMLMTVATFGVWMAIEFTISKFQKKRVK